MADVIYARDADTVPPRPGVLVREDRRRYTRRDHALAVAQGRDERTGAERRKVTA